MHDRPPISLITVENDGRVRPDSFAHTKFGRPLLVNVVANNRVVQVVYPIDCNGFRYVTGLVEQQVFVGLDNAINGSWMSPLPRSCKRKDCVICLNRGRIAKWGPSSRGFFEVLPLTCLLTVIEQGAGQAKKWRRTLWRRPTLRDGFWRFFSQV